MASTRQQVLAARRGDRGAFEQLISDHMGAVCAITTAIAGDPALGEEIGQEVFVCAWQGLSTLEDPDLFGPWVRGIARNRAREVLRSAARRREVSGDLQHLADPAPDESARIERDQQSAALWAAVEDLDEDHREVLVLYYREERSVSDVARALDLAEPTVRKRLSRARERLREGVEERLSERLVRSAPRRAAFVAVVLAAIALPKAARAATVLASGKAKLALAAVAAAAGLLLAATAEIHRGLPEIPTSEDLRVARAEHALPTRALEAGGAREPAQALPAHVTDAFLAAEDARFFEHGAVDLYAIGRAVVGNLRGEPLQGGSTLTQQLAKRMLVEHMPERSLRRKLSEVLMAFELEQELTKEEILALYLDEVYLGAGAWGLEEGAQTYFGKPTSDLTLAESATLAALPACPEDCSPLRDPDRARARREHVLWRMVDEGLIGAEQAREALSEEIAARVP